MDRAIEAFETLAARGIAVGDRNAAGYHHLGHLGHQEGRVFD